MKKSTAFLFALVSLQCLCIAEETELIEAAATGRIDGSSSTKVQTGPMTLGSNGDPSYGIFAPLIGFNYSLQQIPTSLTQAVLRVTIDEFYGGGFSFETTNSITASILFNDNVSADFNELSIPSLAFSETISWFTERGWIDTGADFYFPAGTSILNYGTSVAADVTSTLTNSLAANQQNEFAFLILADNYNGTWLDLGASGTDRAPQLEITYNAIPEPSYVAFIISGISLLGFLLASRWNALFSESRRESK